MTEHKLVSSTEALGRRLLKEIEVEEESLEDVSSRPRQNHPDAKSHVSDFPPPTAPHIPSRHSTSFALQDWHPRAGCPLESTSNTQTQYHGTRPAIAIPPH
jgi:hypothetical protein